MSSIMSTNQVTYQSQEKLFADANKVR